MVVAELSNQISFVGTIWNDDASSITNRLEDALRSAVHGGLDAARSSVAIDRSVLTALSLPSNKPGSPSPQPGHVYQTEDLLVAADAWLVDTSKLLDRVNLPMHTDAAELIGHLYSTEGEAGLDRLDGDFAFVIYDARSNTVIARRDPFGVRPLFWAKLTGGGVAFSSLPEVLIDAGLIADTRDTEGVLDLLSRSAADRPATLTKGLNRLPPCTQMTLKYGKHVPLYRSYWKPKKRPTEIPKTFETWTVELRRLMEKATQSRLPSNGDIAASISSGLDSTSVVMLAERHLSDDQHIFASTYGASEAAEKAYPGMLDETQVASQVVGQSNRISWQKVRYKPGMVEITPRMGAAVWEPEITTRPEFMTAVRATEHGADIVLTGWGGDNVTSYKGYGVPAALLKSGKWAAFRDLRIHSKQKGVPGWKFNAKAVFDAVFSEGSPLRERLKGKLSNSRNNSKKIMTGFREKYLQPGPMNEYRNSNTYKNRLKDIMNPVLALRLEALVCHGLRCGVRYVHPLLDRELISFALTCPPHYEFREGLYRAPIRAAMKGVLPDGARLRAQTGYPLVEAAIEIARLKPSLLEKLDELERDQRLHEWFDFPFIRMHLKRLPSLEQAEQHVLDVSTSGNKQASPANLSFTAVSSIAAVQAALDNNENQVRK